MKKKKGPSQITDVHETKLETAMSDTTASQSKAYSKNNRTTSSKKLDLG